MYLSELFLETLNLDYSEKSVKKALQKCQEHYEERTRENDRRVSSILTTEELRDFWDVAAEFAEEAGNVYEVLNVAQKTAQRRSLCKN